jgi:hypothetical protein
MYLLSDTTTTPLFSHLRPLRLSCSLVVYAHMRNGDGIDLRALLTSTARYAQCKTKIKYHLIF